MAEPTYMQAREELESDGHWGTVYEPLEVTAAMIERGGRALCKWDRDREGERAANDPAYKSVLLTYEDWREEFDSQAEAVLRAALQRERQSGG